MREGEREGGGSEWKGEKGESVVVRYILLLFAVFFLPDMKLQVEKLESLIKVLRYRATV